jgi:uncharacterized protein
MKNPASSFRAERPSRRWYREPWPWLLMAGPFVVVGASLVSAWIAVRSDDGVVADDYYKQGLSINRKLQRADVGPVRPLGATITVTARGEVRVLIEGLVDAPKDLRLKLVRPNSATGNAIVILRPGPDGEYIGMLPERTPGRWIVTLESGTWRLPTTVTGRLSEIRLGTAERHRSSDVDGPD